MLFLCLLCFSFWIEVLKIIEAFNKISLHGIMLIPLQIIALKMLLEVPYEIPLKDFLAALLKPLPQVPL